MSDIFDFDYIFKNLYPEGLVRPFFQNPSNAFLAMVRKRQRSGETFELRTQTSPGGGSSSDFATAQSNSKGGKGKRFLVDLTSRDYSVEEIDGGQLLASRGNEGALEDLLSNALANSEQKMQASMGYSAWGTGSGVLAQVVSDLGGGQFDYTDKRASVFFEVGMKLQTADAPTGGALDAGAAEITAIDREARIVTFTATGGWAPIADRYIVRQGDYDKKIRGIPAWLPFTAPTAGDNFFGVDRSTDVVKLAGVRVDRSADSSHREAVLRAQETFFLYGITTSHVFVAPGDFTQLNVEFDGIGEKTILYVDVTTGMVGKMLDSTGKGVMLGIEAIKIPGGACFIQDHWAPEGFAHFLAMNTWELASIGKAPHFVGSETGEPKGIVRWRDSKDTAEVRARFLGQLLCHDASKNGVVKLPAI